VDNSIGIGDLATILTAVGVVIYVLGLIGLAIPIRRVFTGDLSVAWYAVALIPKTVVAGHGARIWLRWPVALTLLLWFAITWRISTIASTVVVLAILGGAAIYMIVRTQQTAEGAVGSLVVVPSMVLAILALAPALSGLTGNQFYIHQVPPDWVAILPFLFVDRSFTANILLLLVGGFFFGSPPAIAAVPPLPVVEVYLSKQDEDNEEENTNLLKGHLLAHNDGFWHLFDGKNALRSIPDAQAQAVRIRPATKESSQEGSAPP